MVSVAPPGAWWVVLTPPRPLGLSYLQAQCRGPTTSLHQESFMYLLLRVLVARRLPPRWRWPRLTLMSSRAAQHLLCWSRRWVAWARPCGWVTPGTPTVPVMRTIMAAVLVQALQQPLPTLPPLLRTMGRALALLVVMLMAVVLMLMLVLALVMMMRVALVVAKALPEVWAPELALVAHVGSRPCLTVMEMPPSSLGLR